MSDELDAARKRWETQTLGPAIAKTPERAAEFLSASDAPIDRLYTPVDGMDANAYAETLGFPGEFPFTRGIQPTMYRGRLWTMRQYAGFSTAEETNARYRYLLAQGSTGLSVAFDLPTQIGYDSDAPQSLGEVGKVGVAIDTLADMERLFDGIPLDRVSTSMTINATAAILLAMYVVVAERQGASWTALAGTLQNDILKEYIARGTYRFPPRASLRIVSDIFAWASEHLPKWNPISISGYHIREAGSTAAQEIGFTIADAVCYIETALARGLEIDRFAPRLAFFFAAHTDLFEEVAKFRAARRLYARLMRDRFGAKNPQSWMMRFHTQTGGVTLTAQQPENNVVRVTIQALAAVLGGTQSLHTNSKDEALALPTEDAVTTALRTQQVIAHESGVASTVDPLGGSYFVEALTDRLEREAMEYVEAIDAQGGMIAAIEQGYVQREIEEAAYRYGRSIDAGERIIVGVNRFQSNDPAKVETFRVSDETARRQVASLNEVRATRDSAEAARTLKAVEEIARGDGNLMPAILDAVRAYASVGEICERLARVFGEHSDAYHG